MFEHLNFWSDWSKRQKQSLYIFFILIGLAVVLLIGAYYSGGSFIIDWEDFNTTSTVRTLFDKFYSGLYEFSIFADRHVIIRTLVPGQSHVNPVYSYAFLLLVTGIVLFLYALATDLSRFYFVISSVFFAIILLTYRLENLQLFGFYGKEVYAVVLVIFFGVGYYFHAFNKTVSLQFRFSVFAFLAIVSLIIFKVFSPVDQPFLYLASYVIVTPLILSVIFILMLGFEITRGLLVITSQSSVGAGKSNFIHFTIISIVYLSVLTLIFLHKHHYISWKIVFLDAVWILIAATVLGFWGFKKREDIYAYLFDFRFTGAYLYLSLALITFLSYAYFFVTSNDPYVEVLNDAIIISQLSFGLLFLVYVLSNFVPAMMEGHPVHKVLYKPKFMPYFSARLAGLVGVVALFFVIRMAPYYQVYAGYYLSLAQLFKNQNNNLLASEYFNLANVFGRQTHMGNYSLAELSEIDRNNYERNRYLAIAINTNPTDFAFAKLAKGYEEANKPFDEIFTLKNGVNEFPDSGPLQNNLGVAFSKINIVDTAVFHLKKALAKKSSESAALINIPAILTKKPGELNWDSLSEIAGQEHNPAVLNNLAVLYAKNNQPFDLPDTLSFTAPVPVERLVYNYNLLFDQPELADSGSWKSFQEYYRTTGNARFQENLEYAFAHAFIKSGKSIPALRILRSLQHPDSYGYSKYEMLIAQTFMKFGAPEMAIPYFEKTLRFYGPEFKMQYAVALVECGNFLKAREVLDQFTSDTNRPQLVSVLLKVVDSESLASIVNDSDLSKYNFLKYRGSRLSADQFEGVIISMESEGYQFAAKVEFLKYLLDQGKYEAIEDLISELKIDQFETPHIKIDYVKALIRYYWLTDQADRLSSIHDRYKALRLELGAYYLLAEIGAGNDDNLSNVYDELGVYDAFCEEGILAAAEYFNGQGDPIKSYHILLESVEWNPYSMQLNQAYLKSAIQLGLINFSEDFLAGLRGKISDEQLSELERYASQIKAENEKEW